ncbi:MAG: glyoxalase [Marmoricola sp.]|nr:glyoxalase [Marmoricola sp.]
MPDAISITGIEVADVPEAWRAAGFGVDEDGTCRVGGVRIRLVGREHGTGITGWVLGGLPAGTDDLDGVPTASSDALPAEPGEHPNGVLAIDHVVLMSPHLRRTIAAFAAVGADPRRERDGQLGGSAIRQVFYRLGGTILEVVGSPDAEGDGPAALWGITYVVKDIDASAAYFGGRTSRIKDAVQPGRRITTLRHRDLDLSVRTALITPHVRDA